METALFVVAFVSVSVAVVMSVLSRKDVRSLGTDIESLPRKMDATLRDELRQHRAEASESVHRFGDSLVQAQTALGQTQGHLAVTQECGERVLDFARARGEIRPFRVREHVHRGYSRSAPDTDGPTNGEAC